MANVYCIYDKVDEASGPLFEAKNDAVARRMVLQMTKNNPDLIDDYVLYHVGAYDPQKCLLRGNESPLEVEVKK